MIEIYDKTEILVQVSPWSYSTELLIKNGDAVVKNIEFTEVDKHTIVHPTITLTPHNTQKLMDDLWQSGFRPSEGTGSAGSLAATEKHLKDMRDIVFHELNIRGIEK